MKSLYNTITLIGHAADEPKILEEGNVLFTIIVKDVTEEDQYIDVLAKGKTAQLAVEHINKGCKIALEGRLIGGTVHVNDIMLMSPKVDSTKA